MKKISIPIVLILILFLQGNSGCQEEKEKGLKAPFQIKDENEPMSSEYVYGELIVKFKPEAFDDKGNIVSESIKALNEKYGLISMEQLFKGKPAPELANIYKLNFPAEIDIMEVLQEYQKDPSIIYAEPNYIMHIME
jgi:hypothetical protein